MGKVVDKTKDMFNSIGAMQTLAENFPMNLVSFGDMNFSMSFDVLWALFKMLKVDRQTWINKITHLLVGSAETKSSTGFVAGLEHIVKAALEVNLINLLNCVVNPIIPDTYIQDGINLTVPEIDFTGVLKKNPLDTTKGSKFYFDVEGKGVNDLYKSDDFNAYLWYIINRSDKSQNYGQRMWFIDHSKTQNEILDTSQEPHNPTLNNFETKKHLGIIQCAYIDDSYPQTDLINVQINPNRYQNQRPINLGGFGDVQYNKTIFEFNHEFIYNMKLYDSKVITAEICEYLFGLGSTTVNLGFSVNEQIIEGKVQQIIKKVIQTDDMAVEDCYFTFSNDEFNEMLEKAEQNRYNVIKVGDSFQEVKPEDLLSGLGNINSKSTLVEDQTIISKTLNDITATPATDPSGTMNFKLNYDLEFELLRMLVYPFIRPLFTPKVLFLLSINQKIMGSLDDIEDIKLDEIHEKLMGSLFLLIKDVVVKIKDQIINVLLEIVMDHLKPILEVVFLQLILETLQFYKELITQLIETCGFGWSQPLQGNIDNVNYADIIPTQTEPNQTQC